MKGVYVLIIQLDSEINVKIGSLGKKTFPKGNYAYIGSAQNALEKRINRHFRKQKNKFWHIDYLLENEHAHITNVLYRNENKTGECKTAQRISEQGEAILGFGSSDCNCKSHLYRVQQWAFLTEFMRPLS